MGNITAMGQVAQTVGQAVQNITQSAQGAMGSMPRSVPAELASETTKAEPSAGDGARLVDETTADEEKVPEALAESAAPGDHASESAPAQPPTPDRPQTKPSGITL